MGEVRNELVLRGDDVGLPGELDLEGLALPAAPEHRTEEEDRHHRDHHDDEEPNGIGYLPCVLRLDQNVEHAVIADLDEGCDGSLIAGHGEGVEAR